MRASEVAVFEAVAVAFEGEDFGVVDESVDHGGGGDFVAEDLAPAAEGLVAGDDHRGAFVAPGDEHEHQVRGLRVERDVADFVDDQQRDPLQPRELVIEAALALGVGQERDPFGGGAERDAVTGKAGADPQRDREVGLAGARSEGDRLQQLRAVLPCEVRVVAETHPLFGRLVAAKSFKRWNGVLLLVIDLPDGSPGTIRCDATDVLGVVEPGLRSVLDGAGLRALHRLVGQLATRAEVGVSGVDAQVGSPRP